MTARRRWPSGTFVLVALIAVGLAAGGCSAPRRTLPAGAIELDVAPVMQQDLHACGLATVEALAAYHGLQLDEPARAGIAARTAAQEGLTGADLRSVLEDAGLDVYVFRGTLDRSLTGLWRALDDGRPLVVALASAPGRNHYVLLVGYDPHSGDVAVLDPAQGRLVLPAGRFVACWDDAERFTLLAEPSRSILASTTPPPDSLP